MEFDTRFTGIAARTATGETVTGPAIDSVNTFEAPSTVSPKPITATITGDRLSVTLAPRSVTVLAVRQ